MREPRADARGLGGVARIGMGVLSGLHHLERAVDVLAVELEADGLDDRLGIPRVDGADRLGIAGVDGAVRPARVDDALGSQTRLVWTSGRQPRRVRSASTRSRSLNTVPPSIPMTC